MSYTASDDVIDTVPFDAVPAEMQVMSKAKNRVRCKVLYRGKQSAPPSRVEPASLPAYVAQQPNHVRRLLRDCDLSEIVTQKLVSLINSPGTLTGGTDGGLLNGLRTYGFVWGGVPLRLTRFYLSEKDTSLELLSSCLRPALNYAGYSRLSRI